MTEVFAYGVKIATSGTRFKKPDTVVSVMTMDTGAVLKVTANFASVTPHFHKVALYGTTGTFTQSHPGAFYQWSRSGDVANEQACAAYPGSSSSKIKVLSSFVASILDGDPPAVTASEVLDVMNISLTIEDSIREKLPMKVSY